MATGNKQVGSSGPMRIAVAKEKKRIHSQLEKSVEALKDLDTLRLAVAWTVQYLFAKKFLLQDIALYGAANSSWTDSRIVQKHLNKKWGDNMTTDDILHNFMLPALQKVLGDQKSYNASDLVLGLLLFPSIWQAAVDQQQIISGSSGFHVTATNDMTRLVKKFLPLPVRQACNQKIAEILQKQVWNAFDDDGGVFSSLLLSHVIDAAEEAKRETLSFTEARGNFLMEDSVSAIGAAFSMAHPTLQRYVPDCYSTWGLSFRKALMTSLNTSLATKVGTYTRTCCRAIVQSPVFVQAVLPNFVQSELREAFSAANKPDKNMKRPWWGRKK